VKPEGDAKLWSSAPFVLQLPSLSCRTVGEVQAQAAKAVIRRQGRGPGGDGNRTIVGGYSKGCIAGALTPGNRT